MEVQARLDLPPGDAEELARILDCQADQLPEALSGYASAALKEYADMFLGQKVFRRGSDILEYRLFLLIQYALENCIPDEYSVCRLFQTTSSESRSLIRAIMSKYQYQLHDAVELSIQRHLKAATWHNDDAVYLLEINNKNLVDSLNTSLANIDGKLDQISKRRGTVSVYEVTKTSYDSLCTAYNITNEIEQ